jgi:biotin-(acetyl-CoA carboxylase) ligase
MLQYVVTLAVVEAIQDVAAQALAAFPPAPPADKAASPPEGTRPRLLDVRIKWPNDIYANGLKARVAWKQFC